MDNKFFSDDFVKKSRLILCPGCDHEFTVPLEEEEAVCEDCGEEFFLEEEYTEDFIWHPEKKY